MFLFESLSHTWGLGQRQHCLYLILGSKLALSMQENSSALQTLITFYRPSEERWKASSGFGRHADFVDWLYAERNVKSSFMLPKYITNVKLKEKAARFHILLLQCQRGKIENQFVTRKEYFDNWGYHFAYATWWVSFLSLYMTLLSNYLWHFFWAWFLFCVYILEKKGLPVPGNHV